MTVSQADQLVALAERMYDLGISTAGEPYAVSADRPGVALMFRGGSESLRRDLAAAHQRNHHKVPSSAALTDALVVLESQASDAKPRPVFLRVGWHDSEIVLDLADPYFGSVAVLSRDGWHVTPDSPVLFRRTILTSQLPAPTRGVGSDGLDDLWGVANVAEVSRPHVLAWLLSNLLDIPHPILALLGPQGTGKSTTATILATMLDPSPAPLRAMPRDLEAWAVAAAGSYVVPLDNVSTIQDWLSDALCRCATGEGLVRRKLYSDDGIAILNFRRPVLLTSIDPGAMRGDLGDRLLAIDTEPITGRRTDQDIAATWQKIHPRILGALLDLAVQVLAATDTVTVNKLPRMADYARVLAAVDHVLGTEGFANYQGMERRVALDVLEGDHVAVAIRALGPYDGTMNTLLVTLNRQLTDAGQRPPKGWPTTPRGLRGRLNRLINAFARTGITVTMERTNAGSHVTITPANDSQDSHDELDGDGCDGSDRHPTSTSDVVDMSAYETRYPDLFDHQQRETAP